MLLLRLAEAEIAVCQKTMNNPKLITLSIFTHGLGALSGLSTSNPRPLFEFFPMYSYFIPSTTPMIDSLMGDRRSVWRWLLLFFEMQHLL